MNESFMMDYWTRVARAANKLGIPYYSVDKWIYKNSIPARWHWRLFKTMELEPYPFTWEELVFPPPKEEKSQCRSTKSNSGAQLTKQ